MSFKKVGDWLFALIWILLIIFALVAVSCKTKYVSVPEYHNIYVEKRDTFTRVDSIYEKDSVLVMINGDTITTYKTKILYRDRWREKIVYRDSIKTDSIRVPYPVEKKLTFWQQSWIHLGKILFAIILLFVLIRLIKIFLARNCC